MSYKRSLSDFKNIVSSVQVGRSIHVFTKVNNEKVIYHERLDIFEDRSYKMLEQANPLQYPTYYYMFSAASFKDKAIFKI